MAKDGVVEAHRESHCAACFSMWLQMNLSFFILDTSVVSRHILMSLVLLLPTVKLSFHARSHLISTTHTKAPFH